jgi:hypothetical protein
MKTFIAQSNNCCIYKVNEDYLYDVAEFIVKENYRHHAGLYVVNGMKKEIESVYQCELSFAETSQIYIAESNNNQIIGCIRVVRWNKKDTLPMQKIFNINPLSFIKSSIFSSYWHVGRFAVNFRTGIPNLSLFKQLMMCAIYPIYQEYDGYMIAECDSRLLKVMNLLGIDTISLSESVHYLGSETIPVYSDKIGLSKFYNTYYHLCNFEKDEIIPYQFQLGSA